MLSDFFKKFSVEDNVNKLYQFPIKGSNSLGTIILVKDAKNIDQKASRPVLVESFIGEYKKYLSPNEIDKDLLSWRDGEKSVEKYYENYFKTELEEFSRGDLDYWVQATIDEKLVGWATFQREKSDPNEVYMNLLVVHPKYQKKELVNSLLSH